jgi:hypothetical protein
MVWGFDVGVEAELEGGILHWDGLPSSCELIDGSNDTLIVVVDTV